MIVDPKKACLSKPTQGRLWARMLRQAFFYPTRTCLTRMCHGGLSRGIMRQVSTISLDLPHEDAPRWPLVGGHEAGLFRVGEVSVMMPAERQWMVPSLLRMLMMVPLMAQLLMPSLLPLVPVPLLVLPAIVYNRCFLFVFLEVILLADVCLGGFVLVGEVGLEAGAEVDVPAPEAT